MTQWMIVATLLGKSAAEVIARFERWRSVRDAESIDQFCLSLRENALSLSIIYFANWLDRWLMGDQVPGPNDVQGRRFQATCLSLAQALEWADRCGDQFSEQKHFAARLRESATGWTGTLKPYAVVIVREVVGVSTSGEEVQAAANILPEWLIPLT